MRDPDPIQARRGAVCGLEIDGELVLLDTSSGAMHVLNRVAAAVWSELDGERDFETIVGELSEAAGADVAEVRADVARLIDELTRAELIEPRPAAPAGESS